MLRQTATKQTDQDYKEMCQRYIDALYSEVKSDIKYSLEETLSAMHQQVALTYGEVLYEGMAKLLQYYPLQQDDCFVDLGSGLGKLLVQVFLTTEAKSVLGIEVAEGLVAMSKAVCQTVKGELPEFYHDRELEVLGQSFFDSTIPEMTVAFSCSTCFTDDMMYSIGEWLNQHPALHTVMSLKPVPSLNLPFERVVPIECTWDMAQCYIYRVSEL